MYKLKWMNPDDPDWVKYIDNGWLLSPGDYNHVPTPLTRMTEQEYIHQFGPYARMFYEIRQVKDYPGAVYNEYGMPLVDVYLEWYQFNGVMMRAIEDHFEYYLIGCKHEFREVRPRPDNLNRWEVMDRCSKCGTEYRYSID